MLYCVFANPTPIKHTHTHTNKGSCCHSRALFGRPALGLTPAPPPGLEGSWSQDAPLRCPGRAGRTQVSASEQRRKVRGRDEAARPCRWGCTRDPQTPRCGSQCCVASAGVPDPPRPRPRPLCPRRPRGCLGPCLGPCLRSGLARPLSPHRPRPCPGSPCPTG